MTVHGCSWLGPVGGLVHVPCPADLKVEWDLPSSVFRPMSGAATVYEAPEARRVWSIDLGLLTDSEGVALRQLLDPLYGRRALTWAHISTHASATNMLTPRQVTFAAGTWTGAATWVPQAETVDGSAFAGVQLAAPGSVVTLAAHPAIPNRAHTAAMYARSRDAVTPVVFDVVWRDIAAAVLRTDTASVITGQGALERVILPNLTPPAGAVTYELRVSGAIQAAWPTVTLSGVVLPFALGAGCSDVTADIPDVQLLQAWPDRAPLTSATLTVREL